MLELYRARWQIETCFKKLKSVIGFGHLPKYDPRSCRAGLYGKLVVALLAEELIDSAQRFSPLGYPRTVRDEK
ncbi:MAG: transposase [Candidatus Hydrogenedentes bacterium]|nr:transposase [Candidatus Hydrogenedentota bacterium]